MMLNVGYGNYVQLERVLAIVSPDSAPLKRDIGDHKDSKKCIDATYGQRTRSIVYLTDGMILLSSSSPDTLMNRMIKKGGEKA